MKKKSTGFQRLNYSNSYLARTSLGETNGRKPGTKIEEIPPK